MSALPWSSKPERRGMAVPTAMPPSLPYSGATENNLSRGREARLLFVMGEHATQNNEGDHPGQMVALFSEALAASPQISPVAKATGVPV